MTALSNAFFGFATGGFLLGAGTAMVYPTLLAAIADVAHPTWRASAVGVYRLWRDLGYAVGAVLAGLTADALGLKGAMWVVAVITFVSGVIVTRRTSGREQPAGASLHSSPATGNRRCTHHAHNPGRSGFVKLLVPFGSVMMTA